jgi:hypothetical protein
MVRRTRTLYKYSADTFPVITVVNVPSKTPKNANRYTRIHVQRCSDARAQYAFLQYIVYRFTFYYYVLLRHGTLYVCRLCPPRYAYTHIFDLSFVLRYCKM